MWIILSNLVLTFRETNQQVKIDTSMCPSILFIYQGHKLQNFYLLYAIDDLLHNFSHILQRRRPKYNHLSSDNTYFLLRWFTHMEVSNLLLNILKALWEAIYQDIFVKIVRNIFNSVWKIMNWNQNLKKRKPWEKNCQISKNWKSILFQSIFKIWTKKICQNMIRICLENIWKQMRKNLLRTIANCQMRMQN